MSHAPFTPIHKLLVANRGEIASRVQRSAHALGMQTVAVFSDPDATAPFVAEADEAVALQGTHARDTYLDGEAILAAAVLTGADAVHPGYGFLAEDADFAAAVQDRGLVWVGPPVAAMRVMAGKVEAKERMSSVGVPTVPSAVVRPGDDLAAAAARLGLPLLVKASAGGGGKGMRLVEDLGDLDDAVAGAASEAASSFGDGTVFLERYLRAPRHIEVQVIGDEQGTVLHLGDRECSIQRRHQKVIEEAPAPALDDDLRRRMAGAAVAGARAIGYVGAGTFEFLVDGDEFFFLEMNTRLQVEHPVTETVTGLDLVELQLLVASGRPLPMDQHDIVVDGHAVEVRLYAEDPAAGWLPSTGLLHRFQPGHVPGVRWDTGVGTGTVITPFYDSMLAKVIGAGSTREVAAARVAAALDRTIVHGVTTNAGLLARILRDPDFLAADLSTAFLPTHPDLLAATDRAATTRRHLAVAIAATVVWRPDTGPAAIAPAAWRNVPWPAHHIAFTVDGDVFAVDYELHGDVIRATFDDDAVTCRVLASSVDGLDVEMGSVRRRYVVDVAGRSWHVHGPDGATTAIEAERFPAAIDDPTAGGLTAPMPGTVVRVLVEPGETVELGQVVIVIEAMKVEHQIRATASGSVEAVLVAAGQSVEAHAPLVRLTA